MQQQFDDQGSNFLPGKADPWIGFSFQRLLTMPRHYPN